MIHQSNNAIKKKPHTSVLQLFGKMFGTKRKEWPTQLQSYYYEKKIVSKNFLQLLRIQGFAKVLSNINMSLIILVRREKKFNSLDILLDHHIVQQNEKFPFCCFVFNGNGKLVRHITLPDQVPWHKINKRCFPPNQPDEQIITKEQLPRISAATLCNFLGCEKSEQFKYLCRYRGGKIYQDINTPTSWPPSKKHLCYVDNLQRLHIMPYNTFAIQTSKTLAEQTNTIPLQQQQQCNNTSMDLEQVNRSSGICIRMNGLEMALQLGLLNQIQFKNLASTFAASSAFLWGHLDTKENIRHICYYEPRTNLTRQWNFREQMRLGDFSNMFDFFLQRREDSIRHISDTAKNMLGDLWWDVDAGNSATESSNGNSSTSKTGKMSQKTNYQVCCQAIAKEVSHFKIFCCPTLDAFLHQLRVPFLFHFQIKKIAKTTTKFTKKNTLYAMSSCGLIIENLHPFLEGDQCQGNMYHDTMGIDVILNQKGFYFPQPIIDHNIASIPKCREPVYALGLVPQNLPSTLFHYCNQRGEQLNKILHHIWTDTCNLYLQSWNVFISNQTPILPSQMAFKAVMMRFAHLDDFPLCQSIERFKPAYDFLVRQQCHGGFLFSAETAIEKGHPLFDNNKNSSDTFNLPKVSNILELDLNNSYASSAAEASLPGGFCMGFRQQDKLHQHQLMAMDQRKRSETFEFQMTYYVIHRVSQYLENCAKKYQIQCVFHNYSPFGLFYVGKYPLDLVITLQNGYAFFFQFDGQFAHSCKKGCKPLPYYVNNMLAETLQECTEQRDNDIRAFLHDWQNCLSSDHHPYKFIYSVITNCHGWDNPKGEKLFFSVDPNLVKHTFATQPKLRRLVQPYQLLEHKTTITTDWLMHRCPPELTFVLIGRLAIKGDGKHASFVSRYNGGIFALQGKNNPEVGTDVTPTLKQSKVNCLTTAHFHPTLITKDMLHHYVRHFDIISLDVDYCFVFRTCHALSKAYQHLLLECLQYKIKENHLNVKLFKRLFNFSCGYFGINLNKNQTRSRVRMTFLPFSRRVNIIRNGFQELRMVQNHQLYIRVTTVKPSKLIHRPCPISLPIFATIIDYGKIKLHQLLAFLDKHSKQDALRLLYSNIDNLIFGLSANTIRDVIREDALETFDKAAGTYFSPLEGGKFKLEWTLAKASHWAFVTPTIMSYVYVNSDTNTGLFKMPALKKDRDLLEVYTIMRRLHDKLPVTIQEYRRTDKTLDTAEKLQNFIFQLKNNDNYII